MMRFFGLLPFIFIFELALGQSPFKPIIVTLDPFIKKYDSASSREIAHYDSVHTAYQEPDMVGFGTDIKKEAILDSLHKNFKSQMSFFSILTLGIANGNNLVLYGKGENIFSYPVHATSNGELSSLKEIAVQHTANWVISPKEIILKTSGTAKTAVVHIQVYSRILNKIVLDQSFESSTKNLSPYLKCQEKSLECCIMNILLDAQALITTTIGQNHEYW